MNVKPTFTASQEPKQQLKVFSTISDQLHLISYKMVKMQTRKCNKMLFSCQALCGKAHPNPRLIST